MKMKSFFLLNIVLVLSLVLVSPAGAKDNSNGLQPGQQVTYEQEIPINIVFLGYKQNAIDTHEILDALPDTYVPTIRYPLFYGLTGRDIGLRFNFDYTVSFTDKNLTNKFFDYLKQIGSPGDPTLFQLQYNDQKHNVLDVTGPVLYIDAPSVENWLAGKLAKNRSYTLVFVNWYGRPDFNFHVYTKTDEPDPDTGYNFGELRASRKMIAWGGSSSRLWFYDLSAGPEAWTNNWNVDDADVDGNDVLDYRMPPVWEYGNKKGYRPFNDLSGDLGKVARYVAINELFTSSPLYDPLNTSPGVGGDRVVHINMFQDDPNSQGTDWFNPSLTHDYFADFQPYYNWQVNLDDRGPLERDRPARRAFRIFAEVLEQDDCWNQYGDPFAELFCYFDANRSKYIPAYDEADYVAGLFAFNTTDARMGAEVGLLGFADDNWVDGTQSYVFAFDTPEDRDLGYGFTTTIVHEGGHHFGMSHPHDGYDSEQGIDYDPTDDFYYAWSGDESNTVMQYLAVSNSFGQFDRDNMYRWEMAGYLNWSNALLGEIQASPDAKKVKNHVSKAQTLAEHALEAFRGWNYLSAATQARQAYEELSMAADELGITPSNATLLRVAPTTIPLHEGDPIRFPNN
jgi:hypothetical protein